MKATGPAIVILLICMIAAFAVYMGVLHVMVARGLKRAGLPEGYRRRFLWSRHVSHAGLLLLLGAIIFDMSR